MTFLRKIIIVVPVLLVPFLLLVYTERIPALNINFWTNQSQAQTLNNDLTNQRKDLNLTSLKTPTPRRTTATVKVGKKHKSIKTNQRKKYLIYSCTIDACGGLGDRQHGIISTFLLANLTKRKFSLIITKPCDIRQYLDENQVQWEIPRREITKLSKQTVKLLNRRSIQTIQNINFNKRYKADVVYLQTNYVLYDLLKNNNNYKTQLNWLSNITYTQFFAESYEKIFKPGNIIAQKLQTFLKKSKVTNSTKLICAQIRLGRNPTLPADDLRNKKSSVNVVWDFLRRYNDSRLYKIFVTTDSEDVRREAKRYFPQQIMDTGGSIVHVDFYRRASPTVCQGVEKVLLDQYILAHCDVLIHSRSNFGENAARFKIDRREIYAFRNGRILPSTLV